VLHFDLSGAKHLPPQGVRDELGRQLKSMEEQYGADPAETSPGMRFAGVVERAYKQTNLQVAIIIDEYDAPLLDVLHEEERLHDMREVLQEFYQRLKMLEPMIKFCFITGITKFLDGPSGKAERSQLSIFSTINNISTITMSPKYSALCGITEEELTTTLAPDIALLAEANDCTPEEMRQRLKTHYDGYMFTRKSPEIYNPFSLFRAFETGEIGNYWFESGTPTFLVRQMQKYRTDITALDSIEADVDAFDRPTESLEGPIPLLYQSGYLTIKGYDREAEMYTLAIPNQEVQIGYSKGLMLSYVGVKGNDVKTGFALKFWRALKKDDLELALQEMQAYLAGLPYVEGFKKKLEEMANVEGFYEYTFYLIFSMFNVYARTQVKCHGGRIDMVVLMPQATYVFELKMHETAQKALEQIDTKGYALPYDTEGRRVVKCGLHFDLDSRTLDEWVIG